MRLGAEATKGITSNSYMPAFTRIAPYIAQYGPRKYSVRFLCRVFASTWAVNLQTDKQACCA